MEQSPMDYRNFRLHKLNCPEYAHLKLLSGWIVFFALYILTERLIPPERCRTMYLPLDDRIPFAEWFVIPYVFWYLLIVFSLVWFLLYRVESFRRLQWYLMITQAVGIAAYLLFPSRQDLRPEVFPRENLLTRLVAFLYRVDTNTGVCPSLHVAFSLGLASVWSKEEGVPGWFRGFILVCVVLICLSTVFIKQHSVADVLWALPVGLAAEGIVYRDRLIQLLERLGLYPPGGLPTQGE